MDYMTAEQAAEAAKGLTFEKVWEALMESRRQTDEYKREMREHEQELHEHQQEMREHEQELREHQQEMREHEQEMRESRRKMDKSMENLSKRFGELGDRLGELIEVMFTPDLWKKFNALGFPFASQCQRKQFTDKKQVIAEADIFLENGEYAMPVEIKTKLMIRDVDDHVRRLKIIRQYMDMHFDTRKLIGAVAGGIVPDNVRNYAHKRGFFVIVQNGDSASIDAPSQGFKPKEW